MSTPDTFKASDGPPKYLDHLPEHLREQTDFDVFVEKDGYVMPCYSQALKINSKVIAQMLEDTDKEGWGAGVASALGDASFQDAPLFLAICHRLENFEASLSKKDYRELEGVMHLADKLDAPEIIKECEKCVMASLKYEDAPVRWMGVAASVGLTKLAHRCRAVVLERLMENILRYGKTIECVKSEPEEWDALPAAEYQRLINSLLRASKKAVEGTVRAFAGRATTSIYQEDWKKIYDRIKPFE